MSHEHEGRYWGDVSSASQGWSMWEQRLWRLTVLIWFKALSLSSYKTLDKSFSSVLTYKFQTTLSKVRAYSECYSAIFHSISSHALSQVSQVLVYSPIWSSQPWKYVTSAPLFYGFRCRTKKVKHAVEIDSNQVSALEPTLLPVLSPTSSLS